MVTLLHGKQIKNPEPWREAELEQVGAKPNVGNMLDRSLLESVRLFVTSSSGGITVLQMQI